MKAFIEVLAATAEDCVAAARAGADRIELCSSLGVGGLTPSLGAARLGRRLSGLPVMAMLRPRPAGFAYSELELRTMEEDGRALTGAGGPDEVGGPGGAGADGLVFGILREDGRVDAGRCRRLMAGVPACREWCFHRAFDLTPDPFAALEELIELGAARVLTKGQANSFEEGEELLLALRERAAGRIEILVAGVRPYNARRIMAVDGFTRLHLGRFAPRADPSTSARPGIFFGAMSKGAEGGHEVLDEDYLRSIRALAEGS